MDQVQVLAESVSRSDRECVVTLREGVTLHGVKRPDTDPDLSWADDPEHAEFLAAYNRDDAWCVGVEVWLCAHGVRVDHDSVWGICDGVGSWDGSIVVAEYVSEFGNSMVRGLPELLRARLAALEVEAANVRALVEVN